MCKCLSADDVGVSRDTVFQETRPRPGFETGDFVNEKLGGGLPKNDSLQGAAQGCTLSPNLFKVYNDMIVAVEPAKQGVKMGEDTVSGLIFAGDFVGISETPKGLQKHRESTII